jgi:hypothetical protein
MMGKREACEFVNDAEVPHPMPAQGPWWNERETIVLKKPVLQ